MLLIGNEFSSKLTVALEIARAISCKERAEWNCSCTSCKEHRNINYPDLLIIGNKTSLPLEINASRQTLLKNKNKASYYLFLRAIKKLTIRFSPSLWDSSDPSFVKASSILPGIEEDIAELKSKEIDAFEDKKLDTLTLSLEKKCNKLHEECMYETIPISQVRSSVSWLHLVPQEKRKILIIENADRMQEGSRNAFLKAIEEPPSYANFILTTSSKNAIMPTILSRVRPYAFSKRSENEEKEVIERIFKDKTQNSYLQDTSLLEQFFYQHLSVKYEDIKRAAILFWKYVIEKSKNSYQSTSSLAIFLSSYEDIPLSSDVNIQYIISSLNKAEPFIIYSLFLKSLIAIIRTSMIEGNVGALEKEVYKKIVFAIQEAYKKVQIYNMQKLSVLEELVVMIRSFFK